MKMKFTVSALLLTFASVVAAGPLVKEHVDQNAKWLLHLDLDQFRTSKLGQFVMQEIIVKKAEAAKATANNPLTNLDVVKIIGQVHSLTAYGTGFEMGPQFNAVLMLDVEPEIRKILDGLVAGMQLGEAPCLKKTEEEGHVLYSFQNELFAAPLDNGPILLSKSKSMLTQAAAVIGGKSKNLRQSKAFSDFPQAADSFIFLGVAEGFQEHLPIPPEAKVLKKADGARLVVGESAGNVSLSVSLKVDDAEVLKQIQQVVEGTVALGSLSQSENKDLQQLVQSIKVTSSGKTLSVAGAYPAESLIAQARQMLADKPASHHKHKHAAQKKQEPSPADAEQ